MGIHNASDNLQSISNIADFNHQSGSRLERLIFNHRLLVILLCSVVTVILGWDSSRLTLNAAFEKTIPLNQPYIRNFLENRDELKGLGNAVRVVVENRKGDIFDPAYLQALKQINDELFLTPGVDRANVKSLWMPVVRWNEVTEEGFAGGPVMPDNYTGSQASTDALRQNIGRAQLLGNLVGTDFRSSMIFVPLLDKDINTGQPLDYWELSKRLEGIRAQFSGTQGSADLDIRIVGFSKVVGDLLDGLQQMILYFAVAAVIAALIIFAWTRCVRSTVLVLGCSCIAVLWQLGLIARLGYALDPYSILVPFLVFAIGVSHGAQKMNGIMQDVARGTHRLVAARYTFRRLFLAGVTALVADAVGFGVLILIDIPVIQDLAITASIGVALLVFTNLILLPVMLSYTGVSPKAAARSLRKEQRETSGAWRLLERFTERRWATALLLGSALLTVAGFVVSTHLQIGDLDAGASELRPNSRYNLDNAYINSKYSLSSDQFAVIVKTKAEGCLEYQTLVDADRLGWVLQQVPGVQSTVSLADAVRKITAGSYEGSPKWMSISPNQDVLNYAARTASTSNPELFNNDCSVMPVVAYLSDHKAQTLDQVVQAAQAFASAHSTPDRQFLLAAGSAGIEAATNIVVKKANLTMLMYVYAAVIVLCFITFRSWRAVVVAVVPLVITSILCEALMVLLGMGVKVATLPVIALGVGIGVDYALYLLSIQLARQRAGDTLAQAYRHALRFTGKVVALVGVTLAAGVITWAFSPIKFQADMGILLTFMFLWNMLGALALIPALSHFLLRNEHVCGSPTVTPATTDTSTVIASKVRTVQRVQADPNPV
ncbi:RND family transporter [Pseudomonas umsongensis]|jgi:predicted RND superfamily exporter protein|uniref:RND transporter n=1 Tax=Pseudomonas umsongensis TaxID=198618 RepID=A0ABX4E1E8_9PSED|nr:MULTISPECIES: MMPL family transporter [Pseudomonas]MDP9687536.1 putative RND superfamily exporter protein [Pseudomonas mohnii]EPA95181.1 putative RND superfamily exporter [Pseudomonas sp. G5(2012)]MBT9570832.1 RND family transporter [Pseudomonas umsongensis]MDI3393507.1 MMPL family transporter [Pseudomonas sp. V98_8]OXR35111.1 RND transporter [Pseudomonas umsongensis]